MKVQSKIENYKIVNANQNSNEFFLLPKFLNKIIYWCLKLTTQFMSKTVAIII